MNTNKRYSNLMFYKCVSNTLWLLQIHKQKFIYDKYIFFLILVHLLCYIVIIRYNIHFYYNGKELAMTIIIALNIAQYVLWTNDKW
jgi:hypothetical protein